MSWRPIDTAPKDGSTLLLWEPSRAVFGSWRCDDYMEEEGELWLDNSFHDFSVGFASMPLQPTHWMPLPEPPK